MEVVGNLVKTTLEEIEKVLTTRTVVDEPMTLDGVTLIPLVSEPIKQIISKGILHLVRYERLFIPLYPTLSAF